MTKLPAEWACQPLHVRWPEPRLRRCYDVGGDVVLLDEGGDEVLRSDVIADDLVDDLEKPAN